MDNGGGRPVVIREYVHDPEVMKAIVELQKTNAQLVAQFGEIAKQIEGLQSKVPSVHDDSLVALAKKTEALQMMGRNFGLFGLTSTGKSSIINKLLGKEVAEIGAGDTTTKVASYEGPYYTLHEVLGRNDEMWYFSTEYISFWKGLTKRLIVITTTLKEMTKVLSLLDAINLKYDIVINKFDNVPNDERESFKEKIKKEVQSLGLKGVQQIWFVSAKNPDQFDDWLKMVDYLTN